MVFATSSACSLVKAKSWMPLCVVSDSTRMLGSCSGQPVANPLTKSAVVARSVMSEIPSSGCGNKGGHFDLDLGPEVDETVDIEQRRGREVSPQSFFPDRTDVAAGGFIFAAARQIPGEADDVLGRRARFREQLDDPLQGGRDLRSHLGGIIAFLVATGLAGQHDPAA